jgi:carbonic anhydrase/acetyltransferase-like protein (isoleucine patch superfamily)
MICEDTIIDGEVEIGADTIVLPKATLRASSSETKVLIGERNIIEERVEVLDSIIGHANLIEAFSTISKSNIGNFNSISPKCSIVNCTIGNCCIIGAGVALDGVTIADNTSVYRCGANKEEWTSAPADITVKYQYHEALRIALSSPTSPQYIAKNFKMRA